jgi:hypothetical protein
MREPPPSRHPPHFVCLPGAARWPLFSPPACSQPRGSLPGWGGLFFFSTGPYSGHKSRGGTRRNGGGRWDGRCCTRARCVITEHLGDRRKSPVWSTEAIYLLGNTAGVPEERSAALIYAGAPPSLNRHKTWPDCKNGLKKESVAGLDIRNANNGCQPITESCT